MTMTMGTSKEEGREEPTWEPTTSLMQQMLRLLKRCCTSPTWESSRSDIHVERYCTEIDMEISHIELNEEESNIMSDIDF
jgi:hypothetical protein